MLTDFRNYVSESMSCGPAPIVLVGPNGAGKTNCLEAVSLLTAGRGLRGVPFSELGRGGGGGAWAVSANVILNGEDMQIGTGVQPLPNIPLTARSPRIVKIDGAIKKGSGALAPVRMLWLTPAMDGLFTGPAADRRRFVDRFVLSLDPGYAKLSAAYDRAMRQRNKALEDFAPPVLLDSLESQMVDSGTAIVIGRRNAFDSLSRQILACRDEAGESPFPWAEVALAGEMEQSVREQGVEATAAAYRARLHQGRDRDRAAGRTLTGPHRSDLAVAHGPKAMAARVCSTGEQKALLIGLILAQARLIKAANDATAPIILLDEIAAHLDFERRAALFSSLLDLKAQVWLTGTDAETFVPLSKAGAAQFFLVSNGTITPAIDAESLTKH